MIIEQLCKKTKERSGINIITSLLYQFISTTMGLLLPYLIISGLGSESNGLLNSVGQLFTCLGLLEAGIGAVSLQAFYKPVAEGNKAAISSIFVASDKYYKESGYLYAVGILLLFLIYPFFVDSNLSSLTIRLVILYQGLSTLIGYFYFRKYLNLFRAEGKNYVINLILIGEVILRNLGKIIALNSGYDVATVQLVQLLSTCFEAVIIFIYVKHNYAWIDEKVAPNFSALIQRNSVMAQYIAWMIFNHTDILLLTVFTRNLLIVSVYSVYLLVFEAVQNLSNAFRDSYQYKLGWIAQSSKTKLREYYDSYSAVVTSITNLLFVVAFCLCESFIRLYTKNASDINYSLAGIPEMFMIYKILYCVRAINRQIIEVLGHFKKTQHVPIIETIINVTVSVVLVSWLGIYGVLMGTIAALIYSVIAHIRYVGECIFEKHSKYLFFQQFVFLFPACIAIIVSKLYPIQINTYFGFILKGVFVFLIVAITYLATYKIENTISVYMSSSNKQ